MLAHNNQPGVQVEPETETLICQWTSDGLSYLIGFCGTGSYSGEFRLYVDESLYYVYQTSPGNRTAYIADRGEKLPSGVKVELKVVHDDTSTQLFKGTILGGR